MNSTRIFRCADCGRAPLTQTAMVVYLPGGEHAHICPQCAPRCIADPERPQLVGRAALSGQTLEDVERVFAKLGAPVPTTPAECDTTLGLPAGSTEAAMRELLGPANSLFSRLMRRGGLS